MYAESISATPRKAESDSVGVIPPKSNPQSRKTILAICSFFSLIIFIDSVCAQYSTFRFRFLCLSELLVDIYISAVFR